MRRIWFGLFLHSLLFLGLTVMLIVIVMVAWVRLVGEGWTRVLWGLKGQVTVPAWLCDE